jgi:RNA polymerase sigma-70 factor, ECF subfamily
MKHIRTMRQKPIGISESDRDLVEKFKQGNDKAFEQIFEDYSPALLGFLTRMCGNPEDAKESLQDTFMNVYRYLNSFRGEASLKNWIFKIAVTACLKKKRKQQPVGAGVDRQNDRTAEDFPFSWPPHPNDSPIPEWRKNPEELFMDNEFRRVMIHGVSVMPYKYKIVINLRDFGGFSTEEVSRLLGIKESTVKVRLHRARIYLQEWLKRNYPV